MSRRALVVGINEYSQAPLSGCVNDANSIARVLRVNDDGSPNFDVRITTAPSAHISRASLRGQIDSLLSSPADVALFYFSGHGTANDLGGFLVTPDASKYDEGVPLTDVLTMANKSPVREVVILLDSCYSGAFGQIPTSSDQNALLREGLTVLTASRSTEAALESGGSGIFTSLVVAALEGGAADGLGRVTIPSIYTYVDESLGSWDQRPLFKSHVSQLISLRTAQPTIDVSILRMLPAWFPTAQAQLQLDPSFEPDALPEHPENERIFGKLQKLRAARMVEPVGEEHMYFAAMRSKSCILSPLGRHYWRLANEGKL